MKGSSLLSEIRKGEWLLDVHNIAAYYPVINKIFSGTPFQFNSEPKSILSFVDSKGNPLRKNSEGQTIVTSGSIAIVKMHGEVVKTGDYCIYGADEIVNALTIADQNPNVAATVFDIDGPGGAVSAIGLFQEFARDVKTKPIVGFCDSALSLHYWTAIEVCDHIMAANNVSARFGSVGVVLSFADNRKAMEEEGVVFHEIYPEESSHKNAAFTEARKGDYKLIRAEFLSPLAKIFQARVRAKLPNLIEEDGTLKGKTYFADEALKRNMIHSIGGMQKAIRMATVLSSINN
ncbi:S49 family peptidase [Algibacter miyuki]|uniref:S49 family peptidase n=1 Tax=Algibacter miyuki TaxID=1306933 RepID=A0ABV5H429_9FLAO|nr:S49 family peptidase [Algibacter miyuki]MDN3665612.1 S49 family peptidase [Algibacter miyuki]